MQEKLIAFLKELERLWPPPARCHHVLSFAEYGTDEGPISHWEDKLLLQVNSDGLFYPFFLENDDLEKTPVKLALEICNLMRRPAPEGWQISDGQGIVGPLNDDGSALINVKPAK